MRNGVIIVLPQDFDIRHFGITKYRKEISTIFSPNWHFAMKNLIKIHSAILDLLQTYR
jgi:hypothetical protein